MQIKVNTPERLEITAWPWALTAGLLALLAISLYLAAQAVAQGEWWRAAALALGFGGGSLTGLAVFARRMTLTLDRAAGRLTLSRRGLTAATHDAMPLDAVDRAFLDRNDNPRLMARRYPPSARAGIRFDPASGRPPLLLTAAYSTGSGPERAVRAVNAWLGKDDPAP